MEMTYWRIYSFMKRTYWDHNRIPSKPEIMREFPDATAGDIREAMIEFNIFRSHETDKGA